MSSFVKFVSFCVFILSILTFNSAQAGTALTDQQWQQLKYKTVAEGVRSDSLLGTLLTLSHKNVIDENNYEVFYFSALGQFTQDGFVIQQLTLVNESWSQVGENAFIAQRSYIFNASGNLTSLFHRELIKTPQGGISIKDIPTEGIQSAKEHELILKLISIFVPESFKALQP